MIEEIKNLENEDITQIIKRIDNISAQVGEFVGYQQKSANKINLLEQNIEKLRNTVDAVDTVYAPEFETKSSFGEFIRKGSSRDLTVKSLNSSEEAGGVLLVPKLYQRIISEIAARSPMRQLASIETISTNALDIISEDGSFSGDWVSDTEERPETETPKLKRQRIFVHELYAQPKASQALLNDSAIQVESWLAERLRDCFVKAENEAFINGDGNKKPKGILSYAEDMDVLEIERNITASTLLDLISSLREEYLANATFLMNRTTLSAIQKLTDNDGRFIWQQSLSDSFKQTIFGIPVVVCANMPSIAENALAIALGDFKVGYKIVDHSQISVMRDPYTDKPFVKFYAVKRVGGDVVNPDAIKLARFAGLE